VCSFISGLLYEGKLKSAPGRERQTVTSAGLSGTGLRYIPAPHHFNAQRSPEEASVIAAEVEVLLRGTVTDCDGNTRALTAKDVIVVAPYNAHVRCIKHELASRPGCEDVEVGTVDKFQGREAYVVFFATAASTPEDASRGVPFVFNRQRFNVAISRARALAVLVSSPALRAHHCGSVEDVRIANGVCRFIELAAAGTALTLA
jgi:superfamily I DNA and/or RNA helicase